jgi:hypothetical protein
MPLSMLPDGFSRRDSMLVLSALSRLGTISTSEGAAGRVSTPEVMDCLQRMERPEDFWDLLFKYFDDKILELKVLPRGDVRFDVSEVQAHDIEVYLTQNVQELNSFEVVEGTHEDLLTRMYLDGLEEARARAVFY